MHKRNTLHSPGRPIDGSVDLRKFAALIREIAPTLPCPRPHRERGDGEGATAGRMMDLFDIKPGAMMDIMALS